MSTEVTQQGTNSWNSLTNELNPSFLPLLILLFFFWWGMVRESLILPFCLIFLHVCLTCSSPSLLSNSYLSCVLTLLSSRFIVLLLVLNKCDWLTFSKTAHLVSPHLIIRPECYPASFTFLLLLHTSNPSPVSSHWIWSLAHFLSFTNLVFSLSTVTNSVMQNASQIPLLKSQKMAWILFLHILVFSCYFEFILLHRDFSGWMCRMGGFCSSTVLTLHRLYGWQKDLVTCLSLSLSRFMGLWMVV
jgi:hypothetical protein